MKITYYNYYVQRRSERRHFKLHKILENFANLNAPILKQEFIIHGDNLYLFQVKPNIFMFVLTKDHEIIKAVNRQETEVSDLYNKLSSNEQLGFASYVYVDRYFFGIGSTYQGPKSLMWENFIHELLKKIGIRDWEFHAIALPSESTRSSILSMPFLGRTSIKVDSRNSLSQSLLGLFGVEVDELDGFDITLRPKRGQSINNLVKKAVRNIGDDGVEKCTVKAKTDLQDQLREYYIVGNGYIYDEIKSKEESEICNQFPDKVDKNEELQKKIISHSLDRRYEGDEIETISSFYKSNNWSSLSESDSEA